MVVVLRHFISNYQQGVLISKGQRDDPFFAVEVGGVASKVGSRVQKIRQGDRLVALKPTKFGTSLVVDERLCYPLKPWDRFEDIVSQLLPFTIAIHSLVDICPQGREHSTNVLIDLPSDTLGFAFAQVASILGVSVYATYSTDKQHALLASLKGVNMVDSRAAERISVLKQLTPFQAIITNGSLDSDIVSSITDRNACLLLLSHDRAALDWQTLSTILLDKNLTLSSIDPRNIVSSEHRIDSVSA